MGRVEAVFVGRAALSATHYGARATVASAVSEPVSEPTEADGWRLLPDPYYTDVYWRCRLFVREWNVWQRWEPGWWSTWKSHTPADWPDAAPNHAQRVAVWESLFLSP
jgi:hypothetical protein